MAKDYRGVNFSKLPDMLAECIQADAFQNADLRDANFQGRKLEYVNFSGAKLQSANFKDTFISSSLFNGIRTGLSRKQKLKFRAFCLLLSLIGGLIVSYSTAFLYLLISDSFFYELGMPAIVCGFVSAGFLLFGIYVAVTKGISVYFGSIFILIVLLGLSIASLLSEQDQMVELALNSIFGMASVIGGFVGVLAKSQCIYVTLEIGEITSQGANFWWSWPFTILGTTIGVLSADQSASPPVVLFFALILNVAGHTLGKKASNEQKPNQAYLLIRQIPDYALRKVKTSFENASITGKTTFISAKINNADFTGCKIEGTMDITNSDTELINSGELAGSNIDLRDEGEIVKENKIQRPPLNVTPRTKLFKYLSSFPQSQFEELLFALDVPFGNIPSSSASQSIRVSELLNWARSDAGCGLENLGIVAETIVRNSRSNN